MFKKTEEDEIRISEMVTKEDIESLRPLDIDKMGEEMRERDRNKLPIVKHNDQRYLREYIVEER